MDQKLILHDGTVLTPAHAFAVSGTLWVYLDFVISLSDAFEILNDPEKMSVVVSDDYGVETTHEGYTDLYCIRREDNGVVNAGLKLVK